MQMNNTHTGVAVPTGVTDVGLRTRLARWAATRILDFRNMLPGAFGGFIDAAAAKKVDEEMFALFADKKWCCSGEQPMDVRACVDILAVSRPATCSDHPSVRCKSSRCMVSLCRASYACTHHASHSFIDRMLLCISSAWDVQGQI